MHHFVVKFSKFSSPQAARGIDPPNQNPADVPDDKYHFNRERNNWHSADTLGWPFPMLKYKYIFQIKDTETILSNSTQKLLWFVISEMLIAV